MSRVSCGCCTRTEIHLVAVAMCYVYVNNTATDDRDCVEIIRQHVNNDVNGDYTDNDNDGGPNGGAEKYIRRIEI